uniref:Uncharacterized protein n=2 Tax=Caenorhabditis japonica TaxID=281687 RepID=A0A8R1IKQ2_CAEJA
MKLSASELSPMRSFSIWAGKLAKLSSILMSPEAQQMIARRHPFAIHPTPSNAVPTILNLWPSTRYAAMVATGSDMETIAIGGMGNESSIMEDIHETAKMEKKRKKKLRENSENSLNRATRTVSGHPFSGRVTDVFGRPVHGGKLNRDN